MSATLNCEHGNHRICGGYIAPLVHANQRPCDCPCHEVQPNIKILVGDTIQSYNDKVAAMREP